MAVGSKAVGATETVGVVKGAAGKERAEEVREVVAMVMVEGVREVAEMGKGAEVMARAMAAIMAPIAEGRTRCT